MSVSDQLREDVREWARRVFDQAEAEMLVRLDQEVPRGTGDSSPHLADSRVVTEQDGGDLLGVTIEYTADQANWTEEGTAPHSIDPIPPNRFLRFEIGGQVIYARHVDHPGSTLWLHWFSDTCDEWEPILQGAADSV